MVVVKLQGGLGNQLFQYAFGRSIAKSHGYQIKFDITSYDQDKLRDYCLDKFKVEVDFATVEELEPFRYIEPTLSKKVARKFFGYDFNKYPERYINEGYHRIHADNFSPQDGGYYEGYWQNIHYFEPYRQEVQIDFVLKEGISGDVLPVKRQIDQATCSVGVHVRRGDYVKDKDINDRYGVLKPDYYYRAFDRIKNLIKKNVTFFIFSDDPRWTQKTFRSPNEVVVPMHFDCEDLILMSSCDHNIIANSSFSWWAAFLNKNENKVVIAPSLWYRKETGNSQAPQLEDWILL